MTHRRGHRGQSRLLEFASRAIETRGALAHKQGKVVRLMRDTIQSEAEEFCFPDLVVLTICSFVLPKILIPIEDELTWQTCSEVEGGNGQWRCVK